MDLDVITQRNLQHLVDRISGAMDSGQVPLAIFLDLSKTFDTLDHNILLHKLSFLGIKDLYLNLLRNYLSDRKQYVEINQIKYTPSHHRCTARIELLPFIISSIH